MRAQTKSQAPPMNLEAERAVIGACFIDEDAVPVVVSALEDRDFYDTNHAMVFRTIQTLHLRGDIPDPVVMVSGGMPQEVLAEFLDAVYTAANVRHYIRLVREASIRRRLLSLAGKLWEYAANENIPLAQLAAKTDEKIRECLTLNRTDVTDPEVYLDAYEQELRAMDKLPMLKSGIGPLDEAMGGGLMPQELMSIVGSEGSMKTSVALHFVERHIRDIGTPALYFALDMPAKRIQCRRLSPLMDMSEKQVAQEMHDDTEKYRRARKQRQEIDKGLFRLTGGRKTLDDIRRTVEQEKPGLVVIDYLTKIRIDDPNAHKRATQAMETIQEWQLDKRFKCSWIVINQMGQQSKMNQKKGAVMGAGAAYGGESVNHACDVGLELMMVEEDNPNSYTLRDRNLFCCVYKTRFGKAGQWLQLHYVGRTMNLTGEATPRELHKGKAKPLFEARF